MGLENSPFVDFDAALCVAEGSAGVDFAGLPILELASARDEDMSLQQLSSSERWASKVPTSSAGDLLFTFTRNPNKFRGRANPNNQNLRSRL